MFRHTRLILAVLLTGCTTQAGEIVEPDYLESAEESIITQPNNDLLATVEATLDVADQAINEILEDKIKTQNKINSLQRIVTIEETSINNLEGELGAKDSLLSSYQETTLLLETRIANTEEALYHAKHKCKTQCYPTIVKLNQENQDLLYYVDSLQTWIFYLDSLIMTNKRLSKKSTFPH